MFGFAKKLGRRLKILWMPPPLGGRASRRNVWPKREPDWVWNRYPRESLLKSMLELIQAHLDSSKEMPAVFEGELVLAKTKLRWLNGNLKVGRNLDLRQCQRLRGFCGDSLMVGGDLLIGGKWPKRLPSKNLPGEWYRRRIAGSIYESNFGAPLGDFLSRDSKEAICPIQSLPDSLQVNGSITLVSCPELKELPEAIEVGHSLSLVGCGIRELGNLNMIQGNLKLVACPISCLPDGLEVLGDLVLDGLPLSYLPDGLVVGGDLLINNCRQLRELPPTLKIGGRLRVARSPISSLSESIQIGKGVRFKACDFKVLHLPVAFANSICIHSCTQLETIRGLTRVGGDLLILNGVRLKHLPDRLEVEGRFSLDRCRELVELPRQLEVQGIDVGEGIANWRPVLSLVGCQNVKQLPDLRNVNGSIDLADCGVEDLSDEQLEGLTVRWRGVPIEARVLFRPKSIRPEEIFTQRNAEIRRVMLERIGTNRLMQKTSSRVVDNDSDSGGVRRLIHFRVKLPSRGVRNEYRFLNCFCPSTGREYLLQVSPDVGTCRAAAAWLAGFENPDDYHPLIET